MNAEEKAMIKPEFDRALEIWHDGDGRTAILILETLDSEYPNRPYILGMLGAIYRRLDENDRAADYFYRTISLSPKSELASLGLYFSLWDIGKHEEAIKEMERFLSVAQSKEYDLLVMETLEDLSTPTEID